MLTVGWSKWVKIGHPRLYRSMLKTIYGRVLNTTIPYKKDAKSSIADITSEPTFCLVITFL